jgi:hypothetical protein
LKAEADLTIDAVLVLPNATGSTDTAWLPIGEGWRTERGDYVIELTRVPIEWSWSPVRRLYMRQKKDGFR